MVLRVWPRALGAIESIDGDGRLGVAEHELWPPEDGTAIPALLGGAPTPASSLRAGSRRPRPLATAPDPIDAAGGRPLP